MKSRLYAVTAVVGNERKMYLVDAGTKNGAANHVARKHVSASIASGQDVARLMAAGVKPESAIEDEAVAATGDLPGTQVQ